MFFVFVLLQGSRIHFARHEYGRYAQKWVIQLIGHNVYLHENNRIQKNLRYFVFSLDSEMKICYHTLNPKRIEAQILLGEVTI